MQIPPTERLSRQRKNSGSTMIAACFLAGSVAIVAAAADDRAAQIVAASDAPVRLESARILNTGLDPLVLLYAAKNSSDSPIDTFTVTVFVFGSDGRLKARQVAPGRRELAVGETKYSAMVLDVGMIEPTDRLMAGVDQAQRAGSDAWWRADLRPIAEATAAAQTKTPPKKQ
jgi:hypothetical protein